MAPAGDVRVQYHSKTLRLLGVEPRLSSRAVAAVERTEALHGVRLPSSVREFYTLQGVAARLTRPSWCAGAVPLGEFLYRYRAAVSGQRSGAGECPAVRFYQDGCDAVRVRLEGDDPPTNSSGPYPGMGLNLPDGEFLSFAGFVRRAAWAARTDDVFTMFVGVAAWPGGKGVAGPPHVDYLIEEYEEWGRTAELDIWGVPAKSPGTGACHFCFFGPAVRIHLRTAGDPGSGMVPACWWLYADTEGVLFDTYARLWPAHGVPVDVQGREWDPRGPARRRFRKRFPTVRLVKR